LLRVAGQVRWSMPPRPDRDFGWWVNLFKFIISPGGSHLLPGGNLRQLIQAYHVLLLQQPDGHWEPSDDLAFALRAGELRTDILRKLPRFMRQGIGVAMPQELTQVGCCCRTSIP